MNYPREVWKSSKLFLSSFLFFAPLHAKSWDFVQVNYTNRYTYSIPSSFYTVKDAWIILERCEANSSNLSNFLLFAPLQRFDFLFMIKTLGNERCCSESNINRPFHASRKTSFFVELSNIVRYDLRAVHFDKRGVITLQHWWAGGGFLAETAGDTRSPIDPRTKYWTLVGAGEENKAA